jgi:hypothetical protein
MKLQQYQKEAQRTCPDLGSEAINLAHMVLGICSENEEYTKACVISDSVGMQEEIIDQFWYIANYCTIRGFSLEEIYNDRSDFTQEEWEEEVSIYDVKLSKLQDYVKKYLAYGKKPNSDLEKDAIKGILFILDNDLSLNELNLEQGLQNNIDKLRVRFPDKFDTEKAINRNLDEERKELSK